MAARGAWAAGQEDLAHRHARPSLNTSTGAAQHQAFLAELKALGFSERKNFTIEYA
jgi:hypothetical protein